MNGYKLFLLLLMYGKVNSTQKIYVVSGKGMPMQWGTVSLQFGMLLILQLPAGFASGDLKCTSSLIRSLCYLFETARAHSWQVRLNHIQKSMLVKFVQCLLSFKYLHCLLRFGLLVLQD